MAKFSPAQFIREVRQELAKVTWPQRKELVFMTLMVFAMSAAVLEVAHGALITSATLRDTGGDHQDHCRDKEESGHRGSPAFEFSVVGM